jgi:NADH-quinone oxidoreductase subunit M
MIADYGGIAKVIPAYTVLFMIVTLSSVGLPGTNGFMGEFLILIGAFQTNWLMTIFATSGVILAACYMLWMVQRVFFGKVTNEKNENIQDLKVREWIYLMPIIIFIFWIGFYPKTFLDKVNPSVNAFISEYKEEVASYKDTQKSNLFVLETAEATTLDDNELTQQGEKE